MGLGGMMVVGGNGEYKEGGGDVIGGKKMGGVEVGNGVGGKVLVGFI